MPEVTVGERVRQAVARVYGAAPGEFVALRTALVAQAKAEGDKDAAAEIGALRKPSVAAWVINQVVRREGEVIDALRDLGARLRHAQSTLDAAGLAGMRAERDRALADLVQTAAAVSESEGSALTTAVRSEVRDTAIAALADAAAEEVAWSGSLTRALHYSGFGEVDISDAVARTSTGVLLSRIEGGAGADRVADDAAEVRAAGHDAAGGDAVEQRAAARRSEAEAAVAAAERELRVRAEQADQARTLARSTSARVERLRAELATAETAEEEALERAGAAVAARRVAEQELESARQDVADAAADD